MNSKKDNEKNNEGGTTKNTTSHTTQNKITQHNNNNNHTSTYNSYIHYPNTSTSLQNNIHVSNLKVHCGSAVGFGQALPGFLITALAPPVTVPAVRGGLAVWRQNNQKRRKGNRDKQQQTRGRQREPTRRLVECEPQLACRVSPGSIELLVGPSGVATRSGWVYS